MGVIKGKEREENDILIAWAAEQAALFESSLGNRWRHVQGGVQRAYAVRIITHTLDDQPGGMVMTARS